MRKFRNSMCMRGRLKPFLVFFTIISVLFLASLYRSSEQGYLHPARKNERRIASIDGQELEKILRDGYLQKKEKGPITTGKNLPTFSSPKGKSPLEFLKNAKSRGKLPRGGYASRTIIEDATLPPGWSLSPDLQAKLQSRKDHVKKVCHAYGLDEESESNRPNAWEFLINEQYNIAWCPVFKAASSTWMFNFNLLSGYTESYLLSAKDTPIALARKKYPRPTVHELQEALSAPQKPLTFMIARHPFERLVSGYRDKLEGSNRYYRNLAKRISKEYGYLRKDDPLRALELETDPRQQARLRSRLARQIVPTFPQFVQFLIDSVKRGDAIDEHWQSFVKFCSPCLVDYDVFAKVETLVEDGNYIIFKSGIQDVISPKRINISKNSPTNAVAKSYLCQLSKEQMKSLTQIYKYDFEILDYQYDSYFNCTGVDTSMAQKPGLLSSFHFH